MDGTDIIQALRCTPKGQLFSQTKLPKSPNDTSPSVIVGKTNFKTETINDFILKKDEFLATKKPSNHVTVESEKSNERQTHNALEHYSLTDILLNASNEEIQQKVAIFVAKKQKEFENKDLELHINAVLHQNAIAEEIRRKYLQREAEEMEFEKMNAEEVKNKQKLLQERHHRHAKLLDRKNLEAKSEIQQRESIKKKQQEKLMEDLKREVEEVVKMEQLLTAVVSQSGLFEKLSPALKNAPEIMKQIVGKTSSFSSKQELSHEDLNIVSSLSSEAKKILSLVHFQIAELSALETNSGKRPTDQSPKVQPASDKVQKDATAHQTASRKIQQKCSKDYFKHLQLLSISEDSLKDIIENVKHKELKARLSKVIFESLSTLNDNNPETLTRFFDKLCRLFQGEVVGLPGGEGTVSIQTHQSAVLFCMSRLAKKFVMHAEKPKSDENTQGLAILAASIWLQYPDFGNLFLAHMAIKCPFAVPHVEDKEDKTDVEYYRFLGYNIDSNGQIEKEDGYLKRISNIISFYGYVLVAKPLQRDRTQVESYQAVGRKKAWEWLAMVVSCEPLSGITATILRSLLLVVSRDLSKCYGKQFKKILLFIGNVYLPQIRRVSQKDNLTIHNLVDFLEKALGKKN